MSSMLKQLKIIFVLIRIKNLLIACLTLIVLRYFILHPLLISMGLDLVLSLPLFLLLVLSTFCLSAAGYIINDYFDRKTDLINRPEKVIVGKKISRRYAMVLHQILNVIGVLSGVFLSYKIGHLSFSFIPVLVAGLLWFYSTTYKKQLIVGNLVVAFLTGLVPFTVVIYDLPPVIKYYGEAITMLGIDVMPVIYWVAAFSVFAFLTNFIREIIKDSEDFEGDRAYGRISIPIAFGIEKTKYIVVSIIVVAILGVLASYLKLILPVYDNKLIIATGIYMMLLIIFPFIHLAIKIYQAKDQKDYSFASALAKVIMVFGVSYGLLFRYILL